MTLDDITVYKKSIDAHLLEFLRAKKADSLSPLRNEAIAKLEAFAVSGKSIRGCLVMFTADALGTPKESRILATASGLELLHSALLIQDDIMDKDVLRRGKPTLHVQYSTLFTRPEAHHYGVSMAINVADLCLFYGYELLANSTQDIVSLVSRELAQVASGQMQDVTASFADKKLHEDEILAIYTQKTARYTFSLPMMVGALLAGAKPDVISTLETLGEQLGLMFQIHDDELNIMGDEQTTGKSAASDITNEKQTLLALYLQKEQSLAELQSLTPTDLRDFYMKSKTKERILAMMDSLYKEASVSIAALPFDRAHKDALMTLAQFIQTRTL